MLSLKPERIYQLLPVIPVEHALLLFLVLPVTNEAINKPRQPKQNNWFISGSTGIAIRSGEISGDFNFAKWIPASSGIRL
jgi:hypothetical protein